MRTLRNRDQSLIIGRGTQEGSVTHVSEHERRNQTRRDATVWLAGALLLGLLFVFGLVGYV